MRRTTNAKKFRGGLATLKRKLQGVWNDYGVIGNSERLWDYAWSAKRLVHQWLNWCSYNWTTFDEAWERWEIPPLRFFGKPWPQPRQPRPHPVEIVRPIRFRS